MFGSAVNSGHIDANQVPSIIGVIGTLGTADVSGTALTLPIGVNPSTGAMYVQDLSGASGTTNITGTTVVSNVEKGTITRVGNVGTLELGSVMINSIPQVSIGTIPNVNIASGTQQTVGTVGLLKTGTLAQVTSVSNLASGTLAALASGTITGGTLQNLVSGTINALASGTITNGTLQNLVSGTINALASGTISVGTFSMTTGTLNGGTLANLGGGTAQISKTPVQIGTPIHTRGTTGAAVWGTLVAASGAGTKQYVSNVDIVVASGTVDVAVTTIGIGGSTGAGILARGQFPQGGGLTKPFDPVIPSGTNGTLAFWMGGAGTVDVVITYWQGV